MNAGAPGWRQARAELDAGLPDTGCAVVFRLSGASATGGCSEGDRENGWVLEQRLVLSGELAAGGGAALGASVMLLPFATDVKKAEGTERGGDVLVLGAPGISLDGLSGVGVGGIVVFRCDPAVRVHGVRAGNTPNVWKRVKVLTVPGAAVGSAYGVAVAAVGDDDVVVGGAYDSVSELQGGSTRSNRLSAGVQSGNARVVKVRRSGMWTNGGLTWKDGHGSVENWRQTGAMAAGSSCYQLLQATLVRRQRARPLACVDAKARTGQGCMRRRCTDARPARVHVLVLTRPPHITCMHAHTCSAGTPSQACIGSR